MKQLEKLENNLQELSRQREIVADEVAEIGGQLQTAISALADGGPHDVVRALRQKLESANDRLDSITRKRDAAQNQIDTIRAEAKRKELRSTLDSLLAEYRGSAVRQEAITVARKFESITAPARREAMELEHNSITGRMHSLIDEIKAVARELGVEIGNFENDIYRAVSTWTTESARAAAAVLAEFGASDSYAPRNHDLAYCKEHVAL